MESELESWQITDFNLNDNQLKIDKLGLIKIIRSDDGILTLVSDANYGVIDHEKPSPAKFANNDSILGFILDIGIRREKVLASGHGFYFGRSIIRPQSSKIISQNDFDEELFEKISDIINSKYQSNNKQEETEAIRLRFLFDTYNNARLLFPNFLSESYLNLLRIIDALSVKRHAESFALFAAMISSDLNDAIYNKVNIIEGYKDRIDYAADLFKNLMEKKNIERSCKAEMGKLNDKGKFIFSCFYVAYQYRNKFVHLGFPFPDTVKNSYGLKDGSGTAFLNPALGIYWRKVYRPNGIEDGDLIDIHQFMPDEEEAQKFKDEYFKLLPTWHFVKQLTREALRKKIINESK
ncbi:MAG: hypothetical protein WCT16_01395 [Candidatus Buchananbacteria bacterium]